MYIYIYTHIIEIYVCIYIYIYIHTYKQHICMRRMAPTRPLAYITPEPRSDEFVYAHLGGRAAVRARGSGLQGKFRQAADNGHRTN